MNADHFYINLEDLRNQSHQVELYIRAGIFYKQVIQKEVINWGYAQGLVKIFKGFILHNFEENVHEW